MKTINNMPENARVWVYQSNTILNDEQIKHITEQGDLFINQWSAHGASLKASFDILYSRFIIIAVDEQQAMASGCSIDKSVQFMKQLESQFQINLFDRLKIAYKNELNTISVVSLNEFEQLAKEKKINENTIVYNNMVSTKSAFDKEWEVEAKNSWQKKYLN